MECQCFTPASLGCRFTTAYRAVVHQGRLAEGEWVSVHGCGGVGLSAIMIARALGARPVGIDISDAALEMARECGAERTIDARGHADIGAAVRDATGGHFPR